MSEEGSHHSLARAGNAIDREEQKSELEMQLLEPEGEVMKKAVQSVAGSNSLPPRRETVKLKLLADLVVQSAARTINLDPENQGSKPQGADVEENYNKEGFDIAPGLNDLDKSQDQSFDQNGESKGGSKIDMKKLTKYKEMLFSKKQSKFERIASAKTLRECKNYEYFIILPDEPFIIFWNAVMLIAMTCFFTMNPYRLAFARWDDKWWMTIDAVWDAIFLIDIILTFFKAFHSKDFILIDDRKEIAKTYLSGWFFFDLLSILPVYYFCQRRDHLTLFRHLKLVSLPALMKFNKYIKLLKRKFGLARFFCRNISFSVEFERLLSLVVAFFLGCHLIACLWILVADVFEKEKNNWIINYELDGRSDLDIYTISFYFIITTISTVGYGDFSPQTNLERVYVMFLEILGIIFFSFAIGSLTTIIENLNSYDEDLVQKLDTLEGIKRDCDIGHGIYDLSRQYLVFQENADNSEALSLIKDLPAKLRIEISSNILRARISSIKFFKGKSKEFLSFIAQIIEPGFTQEGWYIFREGEKARFIYFLISGKAGYAIESQNPFIYVSIKEEEMFGNTDLLRTNIDKSGNYMRKFSVLAVDTCETAKLSLENLVSVKEHFPQVYDDIFNKSDVLFKRINALKKRSIEMILHQDSSQKITDKNGIQIPIREYKDKVDKNVPVEDAIDLSNVENLEISDISEYSDDDSGANQQKVKSGLSAMISKIRKKDTSGESKVSKLEKKINQLDQKFETLREEIKSDMKAMLEQYLGKANNPEAEGE